MTWPPPPIDDTDIEDTHDEEPPEPPTPWRAGAKLTAAAEAVPVLVEKWDDEIPSPTKVEKAVATARRTWAGVGPTTKHVLNLLLFGGAIIGTLLGIGVAWLHVMDDPLADAHAYFDAASRLNHGQPLYPAGIDPSTNKIYLYPPLLAIVLRPLALAGYDWFALGWELIVVASFVALLRYLGVRRRSTWLAIGLLGVPIGWALTVAQAHVPMTYLLAVGQPWSIAVAANLKLFPALIAIWWFGRRDYQAVGAFVLWSFLLVLVQVVLEPKGTFAFFSNVGFDQIGEVRNISPYAQSPALWLGLLIVGALVTLGLARTRWGWAAAVIFATVSPPRLLIYMLTGLLAGLREPKPAGEPDPEEDFSDPGKVYSRATR